MKIGVNLTEAEAKAFKARLVASLVLLKPELFLGFWAALPYWKQARDRRHQTRDVKKVPDREIFARV